MLPSLPNVYEIFRFNILNSTLPLCIYSVWWGINQFLISLFASKTFEFKYLMLSMFFHKSIFVCWLWERRNIKILMGNVNRFVEGKIESLEHHSRELTRKWVKFKAICESNLEGFFRRISSRIRDGKCWTWWCIIVTVKAKNLSLGKKREKLTDQD